MLKVHSIESLGTLDGPGIRTIIFLSGCPLRCGYCHNPDTWDMSNGMAYTAEALFKKIIRMKPYFKNDGGVTFSGGEALMQAKELLPLVKMLKEDGIHVVLDTSGAIYNEAVSELLEHIDLVLLDVKHTDTEEYFKLTGAHFEMNQKFLSVLKQRGIKYWIRQVIVPGYNDLPEQIKKLKALVDSPYLEKIELLPFHKMGMHKWEKLGITSPFEMTDEMKKEDLKVLYDAIDAS